MSAQVDPACTFCRIVAGELPATIVGRSDRAVAFMDVHPATRGHLLVVPRTHTPDVTTIGPEDLTAVALLARDMAIKVRERLKAPGVNLLQNTGATAWQSVFHLHVHVIPRYDDDPLVLPWSPGRPGDPEVIAEAAALLTAEP